MTPKELSQLKHDFITQRQEYMKKQVSSLQIKLYDEIFKKVIKLLDQKDGKLISNTTNIQLSAEIDKIFKSFQSTSFQGVISQFGGDLVKISKMNVQYFKVASDAHIKKVEEIGKKAQEKASKRLGIDIKTETIDFSEYKSDKPRGSEELAKDLAEKLKKVGFTLTGNIATSTTDAGTSHYVIATDDKGNSYKFRISDHDVTNRSRVADEYHITKDDIGKEIVKAEKKAFPNRFKNSGTIFVSENKTGGKNPNYLQPTDKIISEKINSSGVKVFEIERGGEKGGLIRKTELTITNKSFLDKLITDESLKKKIKSEVLKGITQGKPVKELTKQLTEQIKGSDKVRGGLVRHFDQFMRDAYTQFDSSNAKDLAEGLGMKAFMYQGGKIKTSRCFCIEKDGKIFTLEEASKWKLDLNDDCGPIWNEEVDGKYNPTTMRGGYECRHSLDFMSNSLAIRLRPDLKGKI